MAMQFSSQVDWQTSDFVFAEALLSSAGIGLSIANNQLSSRHMRVGISLAVVVTEVFIWAELAVGIFD